MSTTNQATIKGDSTVLWGTAGGTTISGIIVSVRDQLTGEMVEIPDEVGFTVTVVFFNDRDECEVQLIVKTSVPDLKRGDAVTIAGIDNCLVTEREVNWEQKGARKLTVKATRWSGMPTA
jgi:DNA/RNA endonuclease YhcR with UshA esterase domain